ncbi:unnamed protein product [Diamesa hyperborea]
MFDMKVVKVFCLLFCWLYSVESVFFDVENGGLLSDKLSRSATNQRVVLKKCPTITPGVVSKKCVAARKLVTTTIKPGIPQAWRRDSFGTGLNPILFKFGPQDNSTNVSTTDKPSPNISILRKFGFDTTQAPNEEGMENNTDVVTDIITDATSTSTQMPTTTSSRPLLNSPSYPTSTRSSNRSTTKRTKEQKKQDQKDSNKQLRQTTAQPNRNQPKKIDRGRFEDNDHHYYYFFLNYY